MKRMIKGEIANLIDEKTRIYPDFGPVVESNLGIDGDLIATEGIRAKTLQQSEANLSQEIDLNFGTVEGLTFTNVYSYLKQINGVLHVILNFKAENTTAAAITIYSVTNKTVKLPTDLAKKLYDIDGGTVDQTPAAAVNVALFPVSVSKAQANPSSIYVTAAGSLSNYTVADEIMVSVAASAGISIPANTTYMFSGRVCLSII